MPATQRALRVTDTYRGRLVQLRQRAHGSVHEAWAHFDVDDIDGTISRFVARATPAVTEMQRAAARLTDAYMAAFVTAELAKAARPTGAGADLAARSRAGKPLDEALAASAIRVKTEIKNGLDPVEAAALGLAFAQRNAGEDVLYVARATLDEITLTEDRVIGWRRVTGGGCGACLAAATGAIQADDEVLEVHDNCQCTKEPVLAGVREHAMRPTGETMFRSMPDDSQDELLGKEKAQILRDGKAPFHALITVNRMAAIGDQITEAPLAALHP